MSSKMKVSDFVTTRDEEVLSEAAHRSLRMDKTRDRDDSLVGDFNTTINVQVVKSGTALYVKLAGNHIAVIHAHDLNVSGKPIPIYEVAGTANENIRFHQNLKDAVSSAIFFAITKNK